MSNMSYCRFQNTLRDLKDCLDALCDIDGNLSELSKEEALSYPVGDEMRNMLFREHREIKAKLKSLSALQYRLKHKIAARG